MERGGAKRGSVTPGLMPGLAAVERVRGYRVRAEKDVGVGREVERLVGSVKRVARAVGGVERAWEESVPRAIGERARPEGLRAGVLTIRAEDSSTRSAVSVWLRSGGETVLKRACGATVKRIRVV
ncbi:MAG: DciA family protein [Phycisphaerales bacterium]